MHNYCSAVSKDYIHRWLILYNSLKKYDNDFRFFTVCHNNEVKTLLELMALERVVLITIEQIEQLDPELASVKASRNNKEYSWTSKGSILLYLFKNYRELNHILWLDSDIVFYSSPEPIFRQLRECSVLLTKEGFIEKHMDLNNIYGIFNTGLMGFNRNANAMKCLNTFRKKCIDWCYDTVEPGRWSDQMYVNYWPWLYNDIKVIDDFGINANAWNIQDKSIHSNGGDLYINQNKLVFYHYSGFRFNNFNEFDLCCYIDLPQSVIKLLYVPYVNSYQNMIHTVNKYINNFYNGMNYKELKYMNYYKAGGSI